MKGSTDPLQVANVQTVGLGVADPCAEVCRGVPR